MVHARKAWLQGLSPKQNREVPPLHYETVWRVKQDFPDLNIIINGGITTIEQIEAQLPHVDGVMLGRAAYHNPWLLAKIQSNYFNNKHNFTRAEIIQQFLPYVRTQLDSGVKLNALTRHILGLFQGMPGANKWRRYISENAHRANAGAEVIEQALGLITF